jgi:hypothetical protein
MAKRLSEREKIYWFCILFPIMWPFLPFLILEDVCHGIGSVSRSVWGAVERRVHPECEHDGDVVSVTSYVEREDHPGGPIGNDMLEFSYETTVRLCKKCGEKYFVTTKDMHHDAHNQ